MPVPTREELLKRKQTAQVRLKKARSAYDTFTRVWDELKKEESELLKQLSTHIDKAKMYDVLKKIDELK